ncbi:MAG: hypothetical protein PHC69_00185 [Ruminiclostridium sp.]|nr:hypothetical protein [Ruminiclostridium sp.]
MLKAFDGKLMKDFGAPKQGMSTCDVNRFTKLWFEVNLSHTNILERKDYDKWVTYNKGGDYRKWYGNREWLVFWGKNGNALLSNGALLRNKVSYFNSFIAWTKISSGKTGFRYFEDDFLFDGAGGSLFLFDSQKTNYMHGLLNSVVSQQQLKLLSPTMNFNEAHIGAIGVVESRNDEVDDKVESSIALSHADWDAFETSWDFKRHPLICGKRTVAAAFGKWEREAAERFNTLKANEEELNRIFIDIYGLQDELTPEVEEKDVTVRHADLGCDIRSLISYAVGCMLGRYSLDTEGLAFAGGDWDTGKYRIFIPDKDNILPIYDDDYFDDDIIGRFVDFVRVVYGAETLEENLKYIADALGGKGTPREVIRNYFLNDFYADHCKIYQKRPIYWLFDSGKKND